MNSSSVVATERLTPNPLRSVLLIDAATCGMFGVLLGAGAGALSPLLGLPEGLLRYAGLSLFPIAAIMAFVALKAPRQPVAVWSVVAGNAGWILGSVWLALGGAGVPTTLGVVFLLAQALVVALLTTLEARGARSIA